VLNVLILIRYLLTISYSHTEYAYHRITSQLTVNE